MSGPRRALVAGCAVLAGGWASVAAVPALAGPAPPALSIAVDNGRADVRPGDRLDYTVTVINLGRGRVSDLRLSQTVPDGAEVVSAGSGGQVAAGRVRWTVDVPKTGTLTFRTTVRVPDPAPPGLLRWASVACAATSVQGPPLVCATDSDQLPAGAEAERQRSGPPAPAPAGRPVWSFVGGGALAVGLVAGGLALIRRRRRQSVSGARVAPDEGS